MATVETPLQFRAREYPTHPSRFHARRKSKVLAALDHKRRFVVCRDIMLDRISELCHRALIGHLEYCSMNKEEWVTWATQHWNPILTYVPTISLLANRWLVFVFLEDIDASRILNSLWTIGNDSLVLSRWHTNFDPIKERVIKRHLWVLLSALPFPPLV